MSNDAIQALVDDLHAAAKGIERPAERLIHEAALGAEMDAKTRINGVGVTTVFRGRTGVSLVTAKRFGVMQDDDAAPPTATLNTARVAARLADAGAKLLLGRGGA